MCLPDGFWFRGRHSSELGAAFLVDQWPAAPAASINKYQIGGRHGTVRYPGAWYQERALSGTLYRLEGGAMDDGAMLRWAAEVAAWLQAGERGRLALDAAPDRFYLAEIEGELHAYTTGWGLGAMDLEWVLQPFAYAAQPSVAAVTLSANAPAAAALRLPGTQEAPVEMEIAASGAVTRVEIQSGGKAMALEGFALAAGQKASVSYALETGEVMAVTINGEAGMRYLTAQSAAPLYALPGNNALTLEADGACTALLRARGRWL